MLFLPETARFSKLLALPEGADIGKAVSDSMRAIEAENDELNGVLPKTYRLLDNRTLVELVRTFARIPMDIEGDAFGRIYESDTYIPDLYASNCSAVYQHVYDSYFPPGQSIYAAV